MKGPPDLLNGIPILFNVEEARSLRLLFQHLAKVTENRYDGWQIEMIANVQKVNRVVHTCIGRGIKEPDPGQMALPLT